MVKSGLRHPIDTVLENRSWMGDDTTHSSASKTDDDEFRMELERLHLSEREVSQEIVRAMEAFQYAKPQKAAIVSTNVGAQDTASREALDARNSPSPSCPSDEVSGDHQSRSTVYDDEREQPPAVISPRTPRASNTEQEHSSADSTETSSGMRRVYDDPTADLLTADEQGSLKPDLTNATPYEALEDGEAASEYSQAEEKVERHIATSPWEDKSQVDLESGNRDIFEEESFWDHGLWKTPENSRHERTHGEEWSESEYTEGERSSHRPDSRDLAQLYLPSLIPPPTDANDKIEVESQSQSMSESESERDTMSAFQDEIEPVYWDINKEPHEILEEQLDSQHSRTFHQQEEKETTKATHQSNEDESSSDEEKEKGSCCRGWCNWWRLLLIAVHTILIVAGIIILAKFLESRRSRDEVMYPAPGNDECSFANEDFLLMNTSSITSGTTLGATADTVPCSPESVNGVWYYTIGTGEQMVVTANGENEFRPQISILSGSCERLQCEDMYGDATDSSTSSSVFWFSDPEKTYHILIHGQPAGNFSLVSGSNGWMDPAGKIPIRYQTEQSSRNTTLIIVGVVTGSTCVLFALIAWRWRRLKRSKGNQPKESSTEQ